MRSTPTVPPNISILDIIKEATGNKNPSKTWRDLQRTHPTVTTQTTLYKFPGQGQQATPVAEPGVCEIIVRVVLAGTRQSMMEKKKTLLKFGYSVAWEHDLPRSYTEVEISADLSKAFATLNPISQYSVGPYRIDLYLSRAKVAIECDEYGHRNYTLPDEVARERFIKMELGCQFVRFDPYACDYCFLTLVQKIVTALWTR